MEIYPVKGRTRTLNILALSVRRIHLTGKVTKVWVQVRSVVVSGTSGQAVVVVAKHDCMINHSQIKKTNDCHCALNLMC